MDLGDDIFEYGQMYTMISRGTHLSTIKLLNLSRNSCRCHPKVIEFYNNTASKLRQWPLETVLNWLQTDLDYIQTHNAPSNGIMQALRSTKQNAFDAVLIDGSEFTGTAEFAQTYGATWILLDDILTFKNWNAFNFLINDSRYQLILRQVSVRNGFAVFQRKQQ